MFICVMQTVILSTIGKLAFIYFIVSNILPFCADKTLSQITEQVENGDLPDASESFGQLKQFLPSSKPSATGLNTGLSPVEMEGASPELKDRTRQSDMRGVIHTERGYEKPTVQQKKKKRFVAPVDEGND